MIVREANLEAVAVRPAQYPAPVMPEIAFAGRSNVGKSSLLNLLTGRKSLARVSGSPGKTRTINFYNIDSKFRIVDLPGYGYAKVSKTTSREWGPMMEDYLQNRQNLLKVVQLVDIRHEPVSYTHLKKGIQFSLIIRDLSATISLKEAQQNVRNLNWVQACSFRDLRNSL